MVRRLLPALLCLAGLAACTASAGEEISLPGADAVSEEAGLPEVADTTTIPVDRSQAADGARPPADERATAAADPGVPPTTAPPDPVDSVAPTRPDGQGLPLAPDPATGLPPFASTTAVLAAAPEDAPFAAFDAEVRRRLMGSGAFAVSVAVARDGEVVHRQAFGTGDPFTGTPVRVTDRFRIASISKTLLATAVLQLAEEGVLTLDQPVLASLAADLGVTLTDPRVATITIRQLLSHTSGFPEYERTFFGGLVGSCTEAAQRGLGRGLLADPGTLYRYSNMNYCLLGEVVEQATGRPYDRVVTERVLAPLGIVTMRVAGTYDVAPGEVVHPTTPNRRFMEALGPAGAWLGTPTDLVRVVDALDPWKPGPHLLDGPTVAEMAARPAVEFPNPNRWYGLGLRVWEDGSWGHTGTVENARSMVLHRPDGITWAIVVSGNTPSNSDRLATIVNGALEQVTAWPS